MTICEKIQTIGTQIRQAEQRYGRPENSVKLLAVSKRHSLQAIQQAMDCQQLAFGENYVQEMQNKAESLANTPVEWHFIGPLQSNKTRIVAQVAHWVHAIDRLKIAQRLSEQRPSDQPPLNLCLQINLSDESNKSGITLMQASELAHQVSALKGIHLRGLMAIPALETNFSRQRETFARLRQCQEQLISEGLALDTLSMGMSGDMEAAIAEGATMVRIGTAIFGARKP